MASKLSCIQTTEERKGVGRKDLFRAKTLEQRMGGIYRDMLIVVSMYIKARSLAERSLAAVTNTRGPNADCRVYPSWVPPGRKPPSQGKSPSRRSCSRRYLLSGPENNILLLLRKVSRPGITQPSRRKKAATLPLSSRLSSSSGRTTSKLLFVYLTLISMATSFGQKGQSSATYQ